jgi:SAM-dependent methyltransferase
MVLTTTVTVVAPPQNPVRQLAQWASESCTQGASVLNVGAGSNVSGAMQPLLRRGPYLVGVDPDAAIEHNVTLAERHRMHIEEFAENHPGRFDMVLSTYVLEHVEHPAEFAAACAHVLRPGGVWFALTLNVRHYFGATTWALSRLNAADRVLHWLKADELVHEHHFPTVYRFNSQAVIRRECASAGFDSIDFRCYDAPRSYQWYMPATLNWLPPAYSRMAYAIGSAQMMGHLTFRATKAC